jgi:tRNA threonylcarbamoyladenosine biosynthesis protein TsaB
MRVLAIDTALEACSACVLDTEHPDHAVSESQPMTRGHAEALMPLIARVLERSGLTVEKLDRIAVTIGPGSFTGLRVGIAAARGLALAAGKPAIGLTTLAAYAAPLIAADETVPVVSVIDARHDHVYLQAIGAGAHAVTTPQLLSLQDAILTSRIGSPRLIGTGAELLARAWPADEPLPASVIPARAPDIAWVARLGAAAPATAAPPKPLYLRPPDAQPSSSMPLARA